MRIPMLRAALVACALTIPTVASAQFQTISHERFEYPTGGFDGAGGGIGWSNQWWTGGGADHALITAGGCDAVGNQATTNISDQGCYRQTDLSTHGDVADIGAGGSGQDVLGKDGTTIWVSFCAGRVSDDLYGGFSLFNQGCCESAFLGSPFMSDLWGFEIPGGGGAVHTVAGSNIDVTTTLVFRFDFMPGDERARLWLDPATPHPTGPADLDTPVPDFRFNEVRIQSGQGPTNTGYDFDAIHIEKETGGGAVYTCFGDGTGPACGCGNDGAAGEGCQNSTGSGAIITASGSLSLTNDTFVLTVTQIPNQPTLIFQGDDTLANPPTFGDGIRCCGNNVVRIGTYQPSGNTTNTDTGTLIGGIGAPVSTHPGNSGLMAGDTRCYQAWYRDPAGPCGNSFSLSNAAEIVTGP